MKDDQTEVSNDIVALRNLLELDLSVTKGRWEMFDTPEYTGGVPGPTDYVTLIAELEPSDQNTFERRPQAGKICIVPESARPWLAEGFRSMLEKHRNSCTDLSSMLNCRTYHAKLKSDGKQFDGFICNDSGKSLVYLTVADYSLG
jgi:hypothetical protein